MFVANFMLLVFCDLLNFIFNLLCPVKGLETLFMVSYFYWFSLFSYFLSLGLAFYVFGSLAIGLGKRKFVGHQE